MALPGYKAYKGFTGYEARMGFTALIRGALRANLNPSYQGAFGAVKISRA